VVKQDTIRELVLQKQKLSQRWVVGIEQSDTLIEEATDVLLRLQEEKDENEEEDNEETKDEQRTTEDNTESLPVP
jgi:hypothetical protein